MNDIGLTPAQQALLVGEKYLAARPAVGTTFSATCLPHLMIADQINDKVIRIVDPQTPQSPKTPYSPTDISPFMQQLVSRIDARIALRQRNIDNDEKLYQQIEVVKNQHFSDLEPHLHPAINSWLLLEILYSIQTHAPQTKKWQQSIRTRALALQAQEQQAAALPPIGLEIEVPWTGAVEIDPKNPLPMTYSAFTEHFLLLEHLGIPISGDKQGEVSLRHSHSIATQLALLEQLHRGGYLPIGSAHRSDLHYSLHVNIEIPPAVHKIIQDTLPEEVDTIVLALGIAYTHPERLKRGSHHTSYAVKRNPDGTHRLEIRNQSYLPNENNYEKLDGIRTIIIGLTQHLTSKPHHHPVHNKFTRLLSDLNSNMDQHNRNTQTVTLRILNSKSDTTHITSLIKKYAVH